MSEGLLTRIREWVALRNTASIPLKVSPQMADLLAKLLEQHCNKLDKHWAEAQVRATAHGATLKSPLHDVGELRHIAPVISALREAVQSFDEQHPRPF